MRSNSRYAYWWENGFEGHFGFGEMIQDENLEFAYDTERTGESSFWRPKFRNILAPLICIVQLL